MFADVALIADKEEKLKINFTFSEDTYENKYRKKYISIKRIHEKKLFS